MLVIVDVCQIRNDGVRIVGSEDNDAVLCTPNKTYEIKKVETSNAVCIVPPIAHDTEDVFDIVTIKNDFFELKPIAARLDKLKSLLKASEYRGQLEEKRIRESDLLTFHNLEEQVQASSSELRAAVSSLGAIEFNGFIRIIPVDILRDYIKQLLDVILENGWSLTSVSVNHFKEKMPDIDPLLLSQALGSLGCASPENSDLWELDEKLVAGWSAEIIMSSRLKENKNRV